MAKSVVCMAKGCDSVSFMLNTVIGEDYNTVQAICYKCRKKGISEPIEKYKKASPTCPKCHCNEYIIKRDDYTDEISILCKKCGSSYAFIDVDDKGNKITKAKLKSIMLEEKIAELEERVEGLERVIKYSIDEKIDYFDSRLDAFDSTLDKVSGKVDDLEREIR